MHAGHMRKHAGCQAGWLCLQTAGAAPRRPLFAAPPIETVQALPGRNGRPNDAGMFRRIHAGLREISASTTMVAA